MKTQIINLEPHDDLISIRDKMSWAKTPRILLVWPPRNEHVGVRPFDLVLLRRHAALLGAELGLVVRNDEISLVASQLKLPVFANASEAQRRLWPMRETFRRPRRPRRIDLRAMRVLLPRPELFDYSGQPGTARLSIFSVGVLAVLLIVLYFSPSAEVQVSAPTRPQSVDIVVSADPQVSQVEISGDVPARQLSYAITLTDSVLSSGETVAPDHFAEGDVRLTNLASPALQIPAGTVVLTGASQPVRFATTETVQMPIGSGSTIDVHVRALTPGSKGNLPIGAILAFEGPLGLSISVTNPEPTSGGTDVSVAAPTDADRRLLRDRLLARIKDQAKSQLNQQIQPGDVLLPSTFAFSKVTEETFTPGPDEPGNKLSLTMRAEFNVSYVSAIDLKHLATEVLDASLPAGYELADDVLDVEATSPLFGGASGTTRWHMRASRTLRARIDPKLVISLVQGQTSGHAGELLQQTFGLETPAQISIQPFFWPWLPSLPVRIEVKG